ncbi:hypothetical protein ACRWOO_16465 [Streptomyces sp. NEAU-PBA10]|uniref:Uncharacterized protein n=2 Tax=Streptomyces TaxID=1883 RepID=A0ABP7DZL5_9ACTN|nr:MULTISPECIES: hypothetical protein [Streptomyces]MBZ3908564.1 hypothetical protein [Streptomyces griseiscabiei]MDX2916055.1 hypothetical protein [Streptomyces griseiscabiei]
MQVIVYAVDDTEVSAVLTAFHAGEITTDYGLGSTPTRLDLGFVYSTAEVTAGSAHSLAEALMTNAPTAAFVIWQDPSYPANGSYVGHVPGVGVLEAECNVHGTPLISLRKVIPFFSTSRRTAWTQTEDNEAGQVRQAAEVLDALAELVQRLPGAPSAE